MLKHGDIQSVDIENSGLFCGQWSFGKFLNQLNQAITIRGWNTCTRSSNWGFNSGTLTNECTAIHLAYTLV